jgi:hypothetical protein
VFEVGVQPLVPDLTSEQWERLDAASIALHSRICENLTGENGTGDDLSPPLVPDPAD